MAALVDTYAMNECWTTWHTEIREAGGKPSKVPYSLDGRRAKANDPSTWMSYFEAQQCMEKYGHGGINFMLGQVPDTNVHIGGVDIDACIGPEGDVEPWATEIVELLDSYTEVTPSGTGLRIFFTYLPELAERRWRHHVQEPKAEGRAKEPGIEFYLKNHFMSVTGTTFLSYDSIREIDGVVMNNLQALMGKFEARYKDPPPPPRTNGATTHPRRDDADHPDRIYSAIDAMRNPGFSWQEWNDRGMAIYAATNGQGYDSFVAFSARDPGKFNERNCRERWENYRRSPPTQFSEGSVYKWARDDGWVDPFIRRRQPNGHAGHDPRDDLGEAGPEPVKGFEGKFLDDILGLELRDPLRRVAGLIGEDEYLTLIYGPSTAGKTLLAIDLVFCLLAGRPWFDRKVMKCSVLYIALEGETGFYNRIKAYVSKVVEDTSTLALLKVITMPVNFGVDPVESQIAVAKVVATVKEMNAKADKIGAPRVGAYLVDNLRSAAVGVRENYAEEVAAFYAKTREVGRLVGASPIIIDNTGKDLDRGARGTQAKYDLPDTVIEVAAEPRSWVPTKTRDGALSEPAGFGLEIIDLGEVTDVDGEKKMVRSIVAIRAEIPEGPPKPKPVWRQAHDCLVWATKKYGVDSPGGEDYPTTTKVLAKTRFRECLQADELLEADPDSAVKPADAGKAQARIRAAFSDIIRRVRAKGLMSLHGLYVWPTQPSRNE